MILLGERRVDLRKETIVFENQLGVMRWVLNLKAIYLLRQLLERFKEKKKIIAYWFH